MSAWAGRHLPPLEKGVHVLGQCVGPHSDRRRRRFRARGAAAAALRQRKTALQCSASVKTSPPSPKKFDFSHPFWASAHFSAGKCNKNTVEKQHPQHVQFTPHSIAERRPRVAAAQLAHFPRKCLKCPATESCVPAAPCAETGVGGRTAALTRCSAPEQPHIYISYAMLLCGRPR